MRIDLKVPYSDKEQAKKLGAKWDNATYKWYVIDPPDLKPLAKWLSPDVRHFYKVSGNV